MMFTSKLAGSRLAFKFWIRLGRTDSASSYNDVSGNNQPAPYQSKQNLGFAQQIQDGVDRPNLTLSGTGKP